MSLDRNEILHGGSSSEVVLSSNFQVSNRLNGFRDGGQNLPFPGTRPRGIGTVFSPPMEGRGGSGNFSSHRPEVFVWWFWPRQWLIALAIGLPNNLVLYCCTSRENAVIVTQKHLQSVT